MSDFHVDLGDGRTIVVAADDPQQAASAARAFIGREKGAADAGKSKSENVAQAFGGGALANVGDEATAAVRAAAPGVANWMMSGPSLQRDESIGGPNPAPQTVSTAPTFQGRYDEELARERAKAEQFRKTDPTLAAGSNIAGALASTALALPAGATAVGPSALGNVARTAITGAGIGGVSGFGEGQGFEDRLHKAEVGAGVGGVLGAAARPLAAIGSSVLESAPGRMVADPLNRLAAALMDRGLTARASAQGLTRPAAAEAPAAMTELGAAARLANEVQRARMTPAQVQGEIARLGSEATMSDVGPGLLQLGVNTSKLPGETKQLAQDVFSPRLGEGRDVRAGQRLIGAAEGNQPPPSHFALAGEGQAFDQNLRATGQRAYGEMNAAGLKQTPELIEIENNPIVSKAIDNVLNIERQTRLGTDRPPASPVEIMHKVKQAIWDMGFDASTARPGPNASFYRDLGIQYMDRLKAANPALAAADTAYSQAASLPEHYAAGRSVFTKGGGEKATQGSAPAIEDLLGRSTTPAQPAAVRAGVVNELRSRAADIPGARGVARQITQGINPGGVQQTIRGVFEPQNAENLIRQAGTEGVFANTSGRYLGGPHTAEDLAGMADLGNITLRATPGSTTPRWTESLKAALNWVARPNEQVRNQIGKALLSADPQTQERTLALIAQILQQRAAGSPIAAGAAGAGGAQAGRVY